MQNSLNETRSVKVIVFPLAGNSAFDEQFDALSRISAVKTQSMDIPSSWKSTTFPFKHLFHKNKIDGDIMVEFVRYDPSHAVVSDLDNFQCSRRIQVAFGLINYPDLVERVDPIDSVLDELNFFVKKHPHTIVKRMFVFNCSPSEEKEKGAASGAPAAGDTSNSISTSSISADINTDKIYEGLLKIKGSPDDPKIVQICPSDRLAVFYGIRSDKIDSYLCDAMKTVAVRVVEALAKRVTAYDDLITRGNTISGGLVTPYEDLETAAAAQLAITNSSTSSSSGSSSSKSTLKASSSSSSSSAAAVIPAIGPSTASISPSQQKKRSIARMRKHIGDMCLQVFSPLEALAHFNAAIADSRSSSPVDLLWLAGSLEGSAVAINQLLLLLQLQSAGDVGNISNSSSISTIIEAASAKDLKALPPPPVSPYRNKDDPDYDCEDEAAAAAAKETVVGKLLRLAHDRAREALGIYRAYARVSAVWAASVSTASNAADNNHNSINGSGSSAAVSSGSVSAAAGGSGSSSLSSSPVGIVGIGAGTIDRGFNSSTNLSTAAGTGLLTLSALEAGCALRIAKLIKDFWVGLEKEIKVSEYVSWAMSVDTLPPKARIDCAIEAAIVCQQAGLKRKCAMYLYLAGLMSLESGNEHAAYNLMVQSCYRYGINLESHDKNNAIASIVEDCTGGSWSAIRIPLLAQTAYAAREAGDTEGSIVCLNQLVRLMAQIQGLHQKQVDAWTKLTATGAGTGTGTTAASATASVAETEMMGNESCDDDDNDERRLAAPIDSYQQQMNSAAAAAAAAAIDTFSLLDGSSPIPPYVTPVHQHHNSILPPHMHMHPHLRSSSAPSTITAAAAAADIGGSPSALSDLADGRSFIDTASVQSSIITIASRARTAGVVAIEALRKYASSSSSSSSSSSLSSAVNHHDPYTRRLTGVQQLSKYGTTTGLQHHHQQVSSSASVASFVSSSTTAASKGQSGMKPPLHKTNGTTAVATDTTSRLTAYGTTAGDNDGGDGGQDMSDTMTVESDTLSVSVSTSVSLSVSASIATSSLGGLLFNPPNFLSETSGASVNPADVKIARKHRAQHRRGGSREKDRERDRDKDRDRSTSQSTAGVLGLSGFDPSKAIGATITGIIEAGGEASDTLSRGIKQVAKGKSLLPAPLQALMSTGTGTRTGSSSNDTAYASTASTAAASASVPSKSSLSKKAAKAHSMTIDRIAAAFTASLSLSSSAAPPATQNPSSLQQQQQQLQQQLQQQPVDVFVSSLTRMLYEGGVSPSQQAHALELLDTMCQSATQGTLVQLPVQLLSLRPIPYEDTEGRGVPVEATAQQQKQWDAAVRSVNRDALLGPPRQQQQQKQSDIDITNSGNTATAIDSDSRTTDEEKNKPSSAFFFDPFAAQRDRLKQEEEKRKGGALWVAGRPCTAVVVFRNPLSCPLTISSVTVILDVSSSNSNSNSRGSSSGSCSVSSSSCDPSSSSLQTGIEGAAPAGSEAVGRSDSSFSVTDVIREDQPRCYKERRPKQRQFYISFPKAVELPASCESYAVKLTVVPLADAFTADGQSLQQRGCGHVSTGKELEEGREEGEKEVVGLKIKGVEVCIHNTVHRVYIDEEGVAMKEKSAIPAPSEYPHRVNCKKLPEQKGLAPPPSTKDPLCINKDRILTGVETNTVTIVPPAPVVLLVPDWCPTLYIFSSSRPRHQSSFTGLNSASRPRHAASELARKLAGGVSVGTPTADLSLSVGEHRRVKIYLQRDDRQLVCSNGSIDLSPVTGIVGDIRVTITQWRRSATTSTNINSSNSCGSTSLSKKMGNGNETHSSSYSNSSKKKMSNGDIKSGSSSLVRQCSTMLDFTGPLKSSSSPSPSSSAAAAAVLALSSAAVSAASAVSTAAVLALSSAAVSTASAAAVTVSTAASNNEDGFVCKLVSIESSGSSSSSTSSSTSSTTLSTGTAPLLPLVLPASYSDTDTVIGTDTHRDSDRAVALVLDFHSIPGVEAVQIDVDVARAPVPSTSTRTNTSNKDCNSSKKLFIRRSSLLVAIDHSPCVVLVSEIHRIVVPSGLGGPQTVLKVVNTSEGPVCIGSSLDAVKNNITSITAATAAAAAGDIDAAVNADKPTDISCADISSACACIFDPQSLLLVIPPRCTKDVVVHGLHDIRTAATHSHGNRSDNDSSQQYPLLSLYWATSCGPSIMGGRGEVSSSSSIMGGGEVASLRYGELLPAPFVSVDDCYSPSVSTVSGSSTGNNDTGSKTAVTVAAPSVTASMKMFLRGPELSSTSSLRVGVFYTLRLFLTLSTHPGTVTSSGIGCSGSAANSKSEDKDTGIAAVCSGRSGPDAELPASSTTATELLLLIEEGQGAPGAVAGASGIFLPSPLSATLESSSSGGRQGSSSSLPSISSIPPPSSIAVNGRTRCIVSLNNKGGDKEKDKGQQQQHSLQICCIRPGSYYIRLYTRRNTDTAENTNKNKSGTVLQLLPLQDQNKNDRFILAASLQIIAQ